MAPYYPIAEYYRKKFGEKVYKLPVSIVDTCPNREGFRDMKQCVFCDEWGSFAYQETMAKPLAQQLESHRERISKKHGNAKFLVYFQAYTTTFAKINYLRECIDEVLKYDFVVGVVIGTRPDCISKSLIEMWQEYSLKTYVAIEFGVQSFFDERLKWLERGHSSVSIYRAIKNIRKILPQGMGVDIGLHLMFGLPGENIEEIIETAKIINQLPVDSVKLHNLHVLRNTPLEKSFVEGHFKPIELEEYTLKVAEFLRHLSPQISVHRLSAVASRWDELVAPEWTKFHLKTYQHIVGFMNQAGYHQGQKYLQVPIESRLRPSLPQDSFL